MKTRKKITLSKIYFGVLCVAAIYTNPVSAQGADLDINKIKARLNPAGDLFWDFTETQFEAPKGSGIGTLFNANLWIGGVDNANNLRLAAQTYRHNNNGTDFWPGPLDTVNASIDASTSAAYNKVWKINKSTIDSFMQGKFVGIPPSIIDWPGNGNTSKGQSKHLAPYVDKDGDGQYNPAAGDYPIIRGDQAVYFIYNDMLGVHGESQGKNIGAEIHGMAYAFNCSGDSALNNTIFIHYDIINRSANQLNNAYIGLWADLDIGDNLNDFIGSDVMRSCFYGYDGISGDSKYGTKPAAQAVVFLDGPFADLNDNIDNNKNGIKDEPGEKNVLSGFTYYNNDFSVQGNPVTPIDYYNYMSGAWRDGTPMTYGGNGKDGTINSRYSFPGNSDPQGLGVGTLYNSGYPQIPWDEVSAGNTPGDRRGLGTSGPFTMKPEAMYTLDLAFVFGQDISGSSSPANAVNNMMERVDSIRSYYAKNMTPCGIKFIKESEFV